MCLTSKSYPDPYLHCAICCRQPLADTNTSFHEQGGAVEGVLHASGVLHDALVMEQTSASVRAVFAAKVLPGQAMQSAAFGPRAVPLYASAQMAAVDGPVQRGQSRCREGRASGGWHIMRAARYLRWAQASSSHVCACR